MNLLISFTGCLNQPLGRVARASGCPNSLNPRAARKANGFAMVGVFWAVALVSHHKLIVCRRVPENYPKEGLKTLLFDSHWLATPPTNYHKNFI